MNLLPLLIGFVLMNGFKNKDKKQGGLGSLGDLGKLFSNPDAMGLIPYVTKLFDKSATEEDKNAAMMALMSNPVIFELIQNFMSKKSGSAKSAEENGDGVDDDKSDFQAGNGTESDKAAPDIEKFSSESREFFKPVENVAGVEISQKLYDLYDNWYIKK